jgi:hypothetical protein
VSFTSTISPSAATGSIQFVIDGVNFGSPVTVSGGSAISGSTSSLTAGTHTVTATFTGTGGSTNSSGTLSGGQVVNQAPSTVTVTCPASVTYNAAAQTPCTAAATGVGGLNQSLTVSYTTNTNAGTAGANANFAGDTNHTSNTGSASFTILQAPVTMTAGSYSGAYDASPHSTSPACAVSGAFTGNLTCTNNPSSVGPDAGSGTVTPTPGGDGLANFAITPVAGSWSITRVSSTVTLSCPASVTYNGAAQTPCTAAATGVGGLNQSLTVSYTTNTNAGTAGASANFPGDTNHTGNNGSASFTI